MDHFYPKSLCSSNIYRCLWLFLGMGLWSSCSNHLLNRLDLSKEEFVQENISFTNPDNKIKLSGSLIYPDSSDYEYVVLIVPGSGRNRRNEHPKLTRFLLENGVAVASFDDRGVGKSRGRFFDATTEDFAVDVEACFEYLRSMPLLADKQVGIIGHSEGALMAQIVASRNELVDFVILMGSPGINGMELVIDQAERIPKLFQMDGEKAEKTLACYQKVLPMLQQDKERNVIRWEVTRYLASEGIRRVPPFFFDDVYLHWIQFDPRQYIEQIHCPVLVLSGEYDSIIDADKNLRRIDRCLKSVDHPCFRVFRLPELGHYLQHFEDRDMYNMDPIALQLILDWFNLSLEELCLNSNADG
ncbi:MAG: alpha/beta hydrolase [Bacteroidota bacterium]